MRFKFLIVASMTALLTLGACTSAQAQQQSDSQSVPDAPQPQKKPAPKPESTPPPAPTNDEPASKPPSTKDENQFPEDVSKQAAKAAAGSSDSEPAQAGSTKHPTKDDNPFPESVSRDAAKAAGNDQTPTPAAKRDVPSGVSSSQSSGSGDENEPDGAPVNDPVRARKDSEVGSFYLKTGDYQGALLRYKDATASDPTNVDAIFGLAETQRMLKKNAEAERNYELYLDIVPNGPKAKQAMKALKALGSGG
jgi:tetratricopeptide (TPR) repeat protein